MECSYTRFNIARRFGVPQISKEGEPLQLAGSYASVGVVIRVIIDRIGEEGKMSRQNLSSLARIGDMIGIDIELKKDEKTNNVQYDNKKLESILALAAPPKSNLEAFGGNMRRAEYSKADRTSGPDWDKYGQTAEEVAAQKKKLQEKKNENKKRKYGDPDDDTRFYFFAGHPENYDKKTHKVDLAKLEESGFFKEKKQVHFCTVSGNLRVAFSGGSSHNLAATKRFWGSVPNLDDAKKNVLKDDTVIMCVKGAPLDLSEYMADDSDSWLQQYLAEKSCKSLNSKEEDEEGGKRKTKKSK